MAKLQRQSREATIDAKQLGQYKLEQKLGAGAMGSRKLEVTWYRASWISTGFRVFGVWS